MKQLLTIALIFTLFSPAWAQEEEKEKKIKRNYGTTPYFNFEFGINNWIGADGFPDKNNEAYTVKPFGSWYVALKASNLTHISGKAYLDWGAGVSWYNFKFQDATTRVIKEDDGVKFVRDPSVNSALKSKLTATYINIHAVPTFSFGQRRYRKRGWFDSNNSGFRIGIGAYAGYRLDSYTKTVVYEENKKNKDRKKDAYFINNWRYGARVLFGFKDVNVFVDYDLNKFFYDNKGPELNAFTFGVSL